MKFGVDRKGIDALWFDSEGMGPFPMLGGMDLKARMLSTFHPRYGVDNLTVKVSLEAPCLGGLIMTPGDARDLAKQLQEAADEADAERERLLAEVQP